MEHIWITFRSHWITLGYFEIHGSRFEYFGTCHYREMIRESARASADSPPADIIDPMLAGVPPVIRAAMPDLDALGKLVKREQKKILGLDRCPRRLADFVDLPESLQSVDGESILLYDNQQNDRKSRVGRISLYGSESGLRTLAASASVFADATYAVCPRPFYQLLIVHGRLENDRIVPLAWALMTRKTKEAYVAALSAIKQKVATILAADQPVPDDDDAAPLLNFLKLQPQYALTDFEKALQDAFAQVFPGIILKGCFFHYRQCVHRRVKQYGLKGQYATNFYVRQAVKMLIALSYLAPEEVIFVLNHIYKTNYLPLFVFFELYRLRAVSMLSLCSSRKRIWSVSRCRNCWRIFAKLSSALMVWITLSSSPRFGRSAISSREKCAGRILPSKTRTVIFALGPGLAERTSTVSCKFCTKLIGAQCFTARRAINCARRRLERMFGDGA